MVKTRFWILLLLWALLGGLCRSAQALPSSESPGTSAAAQDATGTVWALPTDNNSDGTLRRWRAGTRGIQAGSWAAQTVPGAAGFRVRALTRGEDGAVYAFWQTFNQGQPQRPQCLVTVHRGVSARILAHFQGAVVQDFGFSLGPMISAGAEGDVWIAGYQPLLWHVSPDGSLATFPLNPEQYFGGKKPESYPAHTLSSLTDGAGHRWFWESETSNWPQNGLRGVLIWDGKALEYHPTLPGMPDRPFSLAARLDMDHLWLATTGDDYSHQTMTHGALYRVDIHTLATVPETPPQPGAFHNITQVFRANGEWYTVEHGQSEVETVLWRQRGGQWQKCLDGLSGSGGYFGPTLRRPWLAEPSGIWLGMGGGAWWLPRKDQAALWVNWRRGLSTFYISALFPMADGSILTVSPQGAAAQIPAVPQPIRPLPPGVVTDGMGASNSIGPLFTDLRQHLWGTRTLYTRTFPLDEWDGKRWRTHLPPETIAGLSGLYACDTLGRLWLTTSNWHPPAQPQPIEGRAIYDPSRDTWTNYATVGEALQSAAALPSMAFLPHRDTQPPLFSGDGRVTYNYNTTIFLYDGQAWRHWEVRDISPSYPYSNLGGSPHFNHDGHLEVALDGKFWDWTPKAGWQPTGAKSSEKYEGTVPPNGPHGLWAIPAVDSQGKKWFTWQGAVYTAWHGLWAKQAELSGPGSPFQAGYNIEDVLRDPAGRLFFVTRPLDSYDLIVWSPPPVPRPQIFVVPTTDDSVMLRLQTNLHGPHWFRWRLNSGPWSTPEATDRVKLTAMQQGDYHVEVQVLDHRLLSSQTSAVAVFSIRVAPSVQVARWVWALLHGTDDAREAAVAGLVKQPDAALPALQAARPGASGAGAWWLDAAIQQILDQTHSSLSSPLESLE